MARRSYDLGVVAFAVAERNRGRRWDDIRQAISERFHIEPPTVRIMLNWHKRYGSGQSELESVISLASAEMARRALPVAAEQSYRLLIGEGLPTLKDYVERGIDWEVSATMVILTMLEQQFGSDVYQRAVREYEHIRTEQSKQGSR